MGNYISTEHINNVDNSDNTCLICWDNIDNTDVIKCIRCNIKLHAYCEETYRNDKRYCKCPHCQQIGTLGCYRNIEI